MVDEATLNWFRQQGAYSHLGTSQPYTADEMRLLEQRKYNTDYEKAYQEGAEYGASYSAGFAMSRQQGLALDIAYQQSKLQGKGMYNPATQTYTSPEGYKQSMASSSVPAGTVWTIYTPSQQTALQVPVKQLTPVEQARQDFLAKVAVQPVQQIKQQQLAQISKPSEIIPETTWQKIVKQYTKAEEYTGGKITGGIKSVKEWQIGVTSKITGKPREQIIAEEKAVLKKQSPQMIAFFKGTSDAFIKTPIKWTATMGVTAGISLGLGTVGKGLTSFPTIKSMISEGVKYTLPVIYGGYTIKRIAEEPTLEAKSYKAGQIIGGELFPGLVGVTAVERTRGWIATLGREKLPTQELIPEDVLSGKERFPTAPPSQHYKLFMEESQRIPGYEKPMMYHQTGDKFWTTTLEVKYTPLMKTSELQGLYGSYGVSPHFLKVGGGYGLYGGDLFAGGKPGTVAVIPMRFVKGIYTAKPGEAFVPAVKTEVEAILPIGTRGELIGKEFYYKWKGTRIPIDIFKTLPGEITGKETISKIIAGYSYPSSYAVTPGKLLSVAVASSYEPSISKPSYKATSYSISKPSSYLKSSTLSYPKSISSSISKISSAVSKAVSSTISTPRYISSYIPSKIISTPRYPPSYPPYKQPPYIPPRYLPRKKKYADEFSRRDLGAGFDVFIIEKKKPRVIARGLLREQALDIGSKAVMKNLRATFGIRKSDIRARDLETGREFSRFRSLFREPRVKSAYKKYGEVYIQKQTRVGSLGGRLAFRGEKEEIQLAKLLKGGIK